MVAVFTQHTDAEAAAIPVLFGIRQFVENMLWLSFRFDAPRLNVAMTYAPGVQAHFSRASQRSVAGPEPVSMSVKTGAKPPPGVRKLVVWP